MKIVAFLLRFVIFSIPLWIIVGLIHLLFILVGYPLIWWQSAYVVIDQKKMPQFRARWMWIYGNKEDGIDGLRGGDQAQRWWLDLTRSMTVRQRIFAWSARRNHVNNLRYVPLLCPRFRPAWIGYMGTGDEPPDGQSGWAYVWQGVYTGLYLKTPRTWFWLGWKFRPSDRNGVAPTDTRLPRCDFATQLQRVHT